MDGLSSSEEIFKHTNDSIDLKLDYYLKVKDIRLYQMLKQSH